MARRGASGLSGILAIDKPSGLTSHDVVAAVRKATGETRVGHAGTLDPMATGVLVVLVGPATRLAPYLTPAMKAYDARIVFGTETDTDDADGEVVRTVSVPDSLAAESGAIAHVADLVGQHMQVPPAYSAIKRDGVVAHRAARAGEPLELQARLIEVTDAILFGVEPGPPIAWNLSVVVSKGTYIRALARDLGRELGTAAHLDGLRRTRSGAVTIHHTTSLDALKASVDPVETLFIPAVDVLQIPIVDVDDDAAQRVSVGQTLELPTADDSHSTRVRTSYDQVGVAHDRRLLAIYGVAGHELRPLTVFPGGVL